MPELPEVQTVVNTLIPHLVGRRVRKVTHLREDMVTPEEFDFSGTIRGRTIRSLYRRGKRIVFALDDGNLFFIHLGMTGRLTVEDARAGVLPHTHLIADIGDRQQLRFRDPRRFGEIRWLGCSDCDEKMGVEPLTMRTSQLATKLAKTKRVIKNALMDQSVIAGLGNIYVDESLFDSRIHPLAPADQLTPAEVVRLSKSIKRVLRRAIRHRGSTLRDYADADGKAGAFQRLHRVYNREGDPCASCRRKIHRIVVGGRSTHFCPHCQPLHS
jgi:formamidopyrimidine-DNA glycosylase